MTNLELIKDLYKPYRITKKNKCTIIESMDGTFVIKKKTQNNIKKIFSYLDSRNFSSHPVLVDDTRDEINIYEYVDDSDYPIDQKSIDMIKTVADLHSRTVYTKEVTSDKYKEIYDNIETNLKYYENEYSKLAASIEDEVFMSPSHYLFIRNYSKLNNQIAFCKSELNKWYENIKNKREIRICTIHNNLSLNHFCKKDRDILISWDNATEDTPILDIYKLYLNDGIKLNFKSILSEYLKSFALEDDELKLLLILLAMPEEIVFDKSELTSCKNLTAILDKTLKAEELIRPYYLVDDEVQK